MARLEDSAFAAALARRAGAAILPFFRSVLEVENKAPPGGYDPVTEADRAAEQAIIEEIRRHYPDDAIEGEEYGHQPGTSGRAWVIDPIDGTRAFLAGLPTWGTLVGLRMGGKAVAGAAMQPFVGDLFSGGTSGASLNGRPIRTRACPSLDTAILATTDPSLFSPLERVAFDALRQRTRLCRLGCDWYAYALLAAGHIDIVVESGLKPHDVLALIAIIEAAGGRLVSWRGGDAGQGGQVVAIGDPRLEAPVLRLLAPAAAS
ncbi:MAG: inositol monophosphatase family protein [Pseudomonadota bacterium]